MDYGLIQGIAEGLKSGFTTYKDTKKQAEETALKNRLAKIQEYESATKIADSLGGRLPKGLFEKDVEESFYGKEPSAEPQMGLVEQQSGLLGKMPGFMSRKEKEMQSQLQMKNIDLSEKGKKAVYKDGQIVIEDISTPDQKEKRETEKFKSKAELEKAQLETKMARMKEVEMGAESEFKRLPKEKQILVENLTKTQATMIPIKSQLDELAGQLKDPNRSDSDKLSIAGEQLKLLNSTLGADAVGAEEVKRIAAWLDPMPNWVKKTPGVDINGFIRQVESSSGRVGGSLQKLTSEIDKAYGRQKAPDSLKVKSIPDNEKQAALDFITKNPNHPKTPEIKKQLGMK